VESGEFDLGRSDLREAAETLEQALTEACASRPAHEADTGELIRIEEMLALASDAARRAISIRRKARQVGESGLESADVGIDQPTSTRHRLFDDGHGVTWDVWAVYPEGRPSQLSALPGTFQSGWLVFESSAEKRRLSPIPSGWLTLPPNELEHLCEQASSASRRARGQPAREDEDTPREE
jgi:hypothetical protein